MTDRNHCRQGKAALGQSYQPLPKRAYITVVPLGNLPIVGRQQPENSVQHGNQVGVQFVKSGPKAFRNFLKPRTHFRQTDKSEMIYI